MGQLRHGERIGGVIADIKRQASEGSTSHMDAASTSFAVIQIARRGRPRGCYASAAVDLTIDAIKWKPAGSLYPDWSQVETGAQALPG